MKVKEIYYKFLENLGYKEIFGLPGSYIMPLWQQFGGNIKIVLSRHESGAVFMADGYSRNNNKPGIVLTTIGPGLTNAITGIACAYEDSIPLIIISGYVSTTMNNKGGFQDSSKNDRGFLPTELLKSITKASFIPQTSDEAVQALENAYRIAMSGRKGPVHISLPINIQEEESNLFPKVIQDTLPENNDWEDKFKEIYNNSKNPIIFCGNGCFLSNATELMNDFSKKLNIPIISSIKGISACATTNKLYLGPTGNIAKNELINFLKKYNADLIISLGSSLSFNSFNKFDEVFSKNTKIIRVDVDEKQFLNYVDADLNINMDVKDFIEKALKIDLNKNNNEINYLLKNDEIDNDDNLFSKISHYLNTICTKNTLIIPDAGNHWLDILYWCHPKDRLCVFTNAGLASMGHAIGASIGFKIANPDKDVICVTGDGSFMMSGFEISEAKELELNIMFLVVNNTSLGRARVYQEMTDGKIISTTYKKELNVSEMVRAMGINSKKVNNLDEFIESYNSLSKEKGVKLIEIMVEKNDIPKILRGKK